MPSPITPAESLTQLATRFGTDKWGSHYYTPHYERHFAPLRHLPISVLEIGIGGFEDPAKGGESLRMWEAFFPNARIYGIDLHDKRVQDGGRIRTFRGSQTDDAFLDSVKKEIGPLHVVIDDGSHVNAHVIHTFLRFFPLLERGGIYAIEDLQTAYWPEFGGSPPSDHNPTTSINVLKDCIDRLNWAELTRFGYQPFWLDRQIVSLHFYHNLAFVHKGENDEPSNMFNFDGTPKAPGADPTA
jgi:hypothetical protein